MEPYRSSKRIVTEAVATATKAEEAKEVRIETKAVEVANNSTVVEVKSIVEAPKVIRAPLSQADLFKRAFEARKLHAEYF